MAGIRIASVASAAIFLTLLCGALAQAPSPAPTTVSAPPPPMISAPAPLMDFAPAPATDCLTVLTNMSDCLNYVLAGSNLTVPDKGCCPELAGLVESNPICLCQLLGSSANATGLDLDLNRAVKLPSVCGVSTPPVSLCADAGYPVPALGPESSMSPGPSPTGGAAASPTTGGGGNGASTIGGSTVALVVASAIAFLPTFF